MRCGERTRPTAYRIGLRQLKLLQQAGRHERKPLLRWALPVAVDEEHETRPYAAMEEAKSSGALPPW